MSTRLLLHEFLILSLMEIFGGRNIGKYSQSANFPECQEFSVKDLDGRNFYGLTAYLETVKILCYIVFLIEQSIIPYIGYHFLSRYVNPNSVCKKSLQF